MVDDLDDAVPNVNHGSVESPSTEVVHQPEDLLGLDHRLGLDEERGAGARRVVHDAAHAAALHDAFDRALPVEDEQTAVIAPVGRTAGDEFFGSG